MLDNPPEHNTLTYHLLHHTQSTSTHCAPFSDLVYPRTQEARLHKGETEKSIEIRQKLITETKVESVDPTTKQKCHPLQKRYFEDLVGLIVEATVTAVGR